MKILLTHRFFYPDTAPYGLMLRTIGSVLTDAGHAVTVLTSIPSYRAGAVDDMVLRRESLDTLEVKRIWVLGNEKHNPLWRLVNAVLYCWALMSTILIMRPEVVTASTYPPVIAAWIASLTTRLIKARFVYHIQDIHPEVSQISGDLVGRGLPFRFLRWLDNQTLRRSSAIIVLSYDMATTLRGRGLGDLPIHVINNFALTSDQGEALQNSVVPSKKRVRSRVIFAGNLGRFQQLPLLAEGVSLLFESHPNLNLLFIGDGAALPELQALWGSHEQVSFFGFMPFDQAQALIKEADIGLVSLLPGIHRVAYPSKVLSYARLGLPILALTDFESELAKSLRHNGVGAVPGAYTPEAIAETLEELLRARIARTKVKEWHNKNAGHDLILSQWRELMDGIESR